MNIVKEIAKREAAKSNHSYTQGSNFEPHEWIINAMIEFAKLHVQQALEEADKKAEVTIVDAEEHENEPPTPIYGVDSSSILNAYPLENIK